MKFTGDFEPLQVLRGGKLEHCGGPTAEAHFLSSFVSRRLSAPHHVSFSVPDRTAPSWCSAPEFCEFTGSLEFNPPPSAA
jgi:hypothetical protein